MFFTIAVMPAVVTIAILLLWVRVHRKYGIFWMAVLGCLLAAATPWFSIWYATHILNDRTANIGAGLLAFAQPVLAPLGAAFGIGVAAAARISLKAFVWVDPQARL
ncbi:MAG: hypothetical protein AAFU85_27730 [Planctomycetota bacterium]